MRKHTKIYMDALGYSIGDYIPCEISGSPAVDIHHIEAKKSGGNPSGDKDRIENLMALTRELHLKLGDVPSEKAFLFKEHYAFLEINGVEFDKEWMLNKIEYYDSINNN